MKKKKFWIWLILVLLWLAVIFGHSAMPASVSREESLGLFRQLQKLFPFLTHGVLRKLGHFGEFAVLGVLLTGCFRHYGRLVPGKPLFAAVMTALCDETLQLFVEGRSGQITDVWIDCLGAACGILLTWLIFRIKKGKR